MPQMQYAYGESMNTLPSPAQVPRYAESRYISTSIEQPH
jgi:hypothetical protein